jgi:hypothetical protein
MNAIVLTLAVVCMSDQSEANRVLQCSAFRKGRFIVTERQWSFIREHMAPEKIGALMHPKHGVNERQVMGSHAVWRSWSDRQWINTLTPEKLKERRDSDPNYFLGLMAGFHSSSKRKIRRLDYRTWELVPADKWTLDGRRKFGPVEYIRLMRADRRLWLGEYSHTIEFE